MEPRPYPHFDQSPQIAADSFIAAGAHVMGDVSLGAQASVWYNCVVRGDVHAISIGPRTNIQDGSVIHVAHDNGPVRVGADCVIGHMALIHACTIGERCLIGMGSIVMDYAVIEDDSMVAAGSMVTPNKHIPSGQLWAGRPARYMRDLTQEDFDMIAELRDRYVELAALHKQHNQPFK